MHERHQRCERQHRGQPKQVQRRGRPRQIDDEQPGRHPRALGEHPGGCFRRQMVERQCEHRQVELAVAGVHGGGVHGPHRRPGMVAELPGGDRTDGFLVDVGDGQPRCRMPVEQPAGQPAVAGTEFQDARIGDIGDLVEGELGEPVVVAEHLAGPVQGPDHAALECLVRRLDGVPVQVLRSVGLQQPVQTRRVRPAARHRGDALTHRCGAHGLHYGRCAQSPSRMHKWSES